MAVSPAGTRRIAETSAGRSQRAGTERPGYRAGFEYLNSVPSKTVAKTERRPRTPPRRRVPPAEAGPAHPRTDPCRGGSKPDEDDTVGLGCAPRTPAALRANSFGQISLDIRQTKSLPDKFPRAKQLPPRGHFRHTAFETSEDKAPWRYHPYSRTSAPGHTVRSPGRRSWPAPGF